MTRVEAIAIARHSKAEAIAEHLANHGITAKEMREQATQENWIGLAKAAGQRIPSADTQALVISMLERREQRADLRRLSPSDGRNERA